MIRTVESQFFICSRFKDELIALEMQHAYLNYTKLSDDVLH